MSASIGVGPLLNPRRIVVVSPVEMIARLILTERQGIGTDLNRSQSLINSASAFICKGRPKILGGLLTFHKVAVR
jgi:hypothetical protein